MKKIQLVVILLLVSFLTIAQSGCEGNKDTVNKVDPYIGGTRGFSIQYASGAPPDEIFDNKQWTFDVEVKLQNVGEADVSKEDVSVPPVATKDL